MQKNPLVNKKGKINLLKQMSQPEEPQQHSTVYRSYQSFRFPFAPDDSTPPASETGLPQAGSQQGGGSFTLHQSDLPQQHSIPIIESDESTPRQSSFHREASNPRQETEQTAPTVVVQTEERNLSPQLSYITNDGDSASPVGIMSPGSVGRGEQSSSPKTNRAPPRALPRRASMVSFRLQRSNSVNASAVTTPREVVSAQSSPPPNENNNALAAPVHNFSESVTVQSPGDGGGAAAPSSTSPVNRTAEPMELVQPKEAADPVEQSMPPTSSSQLGTSPRGRPIDSQGGAGQALALGPSASTAPTRTPSLEASLASDERSAAAQSSHPHGASHLVSDKPTPRASSGVPTPRSASALTPSNRTDSPPAPPVVPKRAGPQLVAKFQTVVRQKLEQERKATQQEEQRKKDDANQKKMDILLDLQRAQEAEKKELAAQREALELERRAFEKERISLLSSIHKERAAIQQEWYILGQEMENIEKQKALLVPSPQSWRGEGVIVSPSRDEFKRVDPMVLRDLLQQSPHKAAFAYEAPEPLPHMVSTSRAASSSRDTKPTEEDMSRAEALRNFESWHDPVRYKQDGRGNYTRGAVVPLQIEYQQKSSPTKDDKTPAKDSKDAVDEYVEVTASTPNFRLFSRKGRM